MSLFFSVGKLLEAPEHKQNFTHVLMHDGEATLYEQEHINLSKTLTPNDAVVIAGSLSLVPLPTGTVKRMEAKVFQRVTDPSKVRSRTDNRRFLVRLNISFFQPLIVCITLLLLSPSSDLADLVWCSYN